MCCSQGAGLSVGPTSSVLELTEGHTPTPPASHFSSSLFGILALQPPFCGDLMPPRCSQPSGPPGWELGVSCLAPPPPSPLPAQERCSWGHWPRAIPGKCRPPLPHGFEGPPHEPDGTLPVSLRATPGGYKTLGAESHPLEACPTPGNGRDTLGVKVTTLGIGGATLWVGISWEAVGHPCDWGSYP